MNFYGNKKTLAFVMAFCMAFAVWLPVPAFAHTEREKMSVGESREFTHYADPATGIRAYSQLDDFFWELTSGSGVVLITSGSTSQTCTVRALAPGNAVVKGTASDKSGRSYSHVVNISVEEVTFTVRLDATGGTVYPSKLTAVLGRSYGSLPTPERQGYNFDGWYTSQSGGTKIQSSSIVDLDADTAFYAHWTQTPQPKDVIFLDVPSGAYYYDAVAWAFKNGVTTGKTEDLFKPFDGCTRGNVVTFLWRAMGKPAPSASANPFSDIATESYCYSSVLWAMEQGVTQGTSASMFSPGQSCTKGHIITFLYRTMGEPGKTGNGPYYYSDAVRWGESQGIFVGIDAIFDANENCSRADAVTYLYRALVQAQDAPSPTPPNPKPVTDDDPFCKTCGGSGSCSEQCSSGQVQCKSCHMGKCKVCGGLGEIPNAKGETKKCTARNCDRGNCAKCGGDGWDDCSACHGEGKCPTCHGSGLKAGRTL